MRAKVLAVVFAIMVAIGCADPNAQRSAVVRRIEFAGAGDVSSLTAPELVEWIEHHPEKEAMFRDLNLDCAPLRIRAAADWSMRTAEGRVCSAVEQTDTYVPRDADKTAY